MSAARHIMRKEMVQPSSNQGRAGSSPDNAENGKVSRDRERRASYSSTATDDSGYSSVFRNAFLEGKTVQFFQTSDDYLYAMTEDLAEWFNVLYDCGMTVETFFDQLDDGVTLCRHANEVQRAGEEYIEVTGRRDLPMKVGNVVPVIPPRGLVYRSNAPVGSFMARDNIANFIFWCRAFGIPNTLSFETEDLVARKNIRSVVVCLLEVARIGAKFGMEVPDIVQLEEEIDAEIEAEKSAEEAAAVDDEPDFRPPSPTTGTLRAPTITTRRIIRTPTTLPATPAIPRERAPLIPPGIVHQRRQRPKCDMKSLDEMVRDILATCTCEETFPMKRIGEGKYLFGDKSLLIFVRILRNHVMVRVGGGWDTLNHFLEKYDPCRKDKQCYKSGVPTVLPPRPRSGSLISTPADCKASQESLSSTNGSVASALAAVAGGGDGGGVGFSEGRLTLTTQGRGKGNGVSALPVMPTRKGSVPVVGSGEERLRTPRVKAGQTQESRLSPVKTLGPATPQSSDPIQQTRRPSPDLGAEMTDGKQRTETRPRPAEMTETRTRPTEMTDGKQSTKTRTRPAEMTDGKQRTQIRPKPAEASNPNVDRIGSMILSHSLDYLRENLAQLTAHLEEPESTTPTPQASSDLYRQMQEDLNHMQQGHQTISRSSPAKDQRSVKRPLTPSSRIPKPVTSSTAPQKSLGRGTRSNSLALSSAPVSKNVTPRGSRRNSVELNSSALSSVGARTEKRQRGPKKS